MGSMTRTPSPQKYRIGYVAKLLGVNSSTIRFWETEFDCLPSRRSEKGQRFYTDDDIETLGYIKYLLHDLKLTLEGARKQLGETRSAGTKKPSTDLSAMHAGHAVCSSNDALQELADPQLKAEGTKTENDISAKKHELASIAEELNALASSMLERAAFI